MRKIKNEENSIILLLLLRTRDIEQLFMLTILEENKVVMFTLFVNFYW